LFTSGLVNHGTFLTDEYKEAGGFLTINQPVDYMARGFMISMRGLDIMRAIGRVALKVEPVLGPEIARATASAIWAQNKRVPYKKNRLINS